MTYIVKFNPHAKQHQVLVDPNKLVAVCAGRRSGKTKTGQYKVQQMLLTFDPSLKGLSEQHILVGMPTLKQARAVWWQELKLQFSDHPLVTAISESDFRIVTRRPYPDIILRGTNDQQGNALRGIEIYGAVLDEFADIKPAAWYEAIYPACKGQILIIGTPKGKAGLFYETYNLPTTSRYHFTTLDNPFYPKAQVEYARSILSDRAFRQEFLACWEDYEGQIFTGYKGPQPTKLFTNPIYYLGVDWGDRNPAVVVIAGSPNTPEHQVIDYWYNTTNEPITNDHLIGHVIKQFVAKYGARAVFMPDDRTGSIYEARQHNIPAVAVRRSKPGVIERIEIVNSLFDTNTLTISDQLPPKLHNELTAYRFAPDGKPVGNDHLIDAMMYCVATLNYKRYQWKLAN